MIKRTLGSVALCGWLMAASGLVAGSSFPRGRVRHEKGNERRGDGAQLSSFPIPTGR